MRRAEHFLDGHPELTLWMEMSLAAHGVGYPAPALQSLPAVAEAQATMTSDPRLAQCAVAHAIEAALATRYDRLAAFFDPETLGSHLSEAVTQLLLEGRSAACGEDRGRWRFGDQRFGDIRDKLGRLIRGEETGLSHGTVVGLARERGLELSSDSEPVEHYGLIRWHPANVTGPGEMRLMLFGDRVPARVISASGRLTGPGEPVRQVTTACSKALRWDRPEIQQLLIEQLFPESANMPAKDGPP